MKSNLAFILLILLSFSPLIMAQETLIEIPHTDTENSFLLDGERSSSFWARSKILPPLINDEATTSLTDKQCQIELVESNSWIIFGITINETKNIIVTESMHNEPQWFDDNVIIEINGREKLSVQTNPLGALNVNVNDKLTMSPITQEKIKVCARINDTAWRSDHPHPHRRDLRLSPLTSLSHVGKTHSFRDPPPLARPDHHARDGQRQKKHAT